MNFLSQFSKNCNLDSTHLESKGISLINTRKRNILGIKFFECKIYPSSIFQNSSRKSLRTTTRRETRQRISVFECSKVYKGGTARNIYSAEEVHLFIDMPIFVLSVTLAFPYLPVFPIRRRGEEQGRNSPRRPHTAMTSSISRRERRGLFRFSRVSKGGRDQGQNLLKPSINSPSPRTSY